MVLYVILVCAFLMIQTCVIEGVIDGGLQQDVEERIEAELGKRTTLRFNNTFSSNDFFLLNWIIWGPYETALYMNSSSKLSAWESKDIEKYIAETDSSLTVTLREFKRHHAGKWRVHREYCELGNHQNIMHKNISFSVHGIEFDNRYHEKSLKMRDEEYIVMNFPEEYLDYSVCSLVKIEPNTVYDLNAELYRHPKGHEGIKRLDPCGFRMHVRNTSNGNWSLVGRFGYIEKRAYFEVVVDPSTSRPPKNLSTTNVSGAVRNQTRREDRKRSSLGQKTLSREKKTAMVSMLFVADWNKISVRCDKKLSHSGDRDTLYSTRSENIFSQPLQFGWTGFPVKFELETDLPHTYWELERPDGNVLYPRNMSSKYLNLISITSDDNGTWIARAALNSDLFLTEQKIIIQISDFPRTLFGFKRFRSKDRYIHVDIDYDIQICLFIKGRCHGLRKNATSLNCHIIENEDCSPDCMPTCVNRQSFDLQELGSILKIFAIGAQIFRLTSNLSTIDFFMGYNEDKFQESQIQLSFAWHSFQEKKYVAHGTSFEVKCFVSTPLRQCLLISPKNEVYIRGNDSFITSKNCYKKIGKCGCIAIVENATNNHSGYWIWKMVLENDREVQSQVPIEVLESPLISQIVPLSNLFWDGLLVCKTSPIMYYKKVRYWEWLRPDGVRLSENNSMQYNQIERENNCTLALLGSSEENHGIWKCIARIDGYHEDEIYATLNVSKESFKNTKIHSKKESWPRSDFKFRQILEDDGSLRKQLTLYLWVDNESRFCTIKDQSGNFFDASRMNDHDFSRWYFHLNIMEVSEEVVTHQLKILLDNGDDMSASMLVAVGDSQLEKNEGLVHFWHTVPKIVLLKCGSKFENEYRANRPLQSCTLESRNGSRYDQQTHSDEDFVQVRMEKEGYSCWIMIKPQCDTEDHSGNWFLEMKTESGPESRDPLPIRVIESYIVLEAERGIYLNGTIKLHCRRRTIMYDVKIRNCKWFGPGGGQIFTNESMKYNETEEYDVCSLELRDPSDNDFGTWKCSAGVDGYSDEEIATLNLSPTFITPNKHYKKQEIVMDVESKMGPTKLRMMIGDTAEFICSASIRNFRDRIEWRYNDSVRINPSERIRINELPKTTTHYRSMLSINPTLRSDNRTFICSTMLRGNHTDTSYVSTSYEIEFRDDAPFFVDTNMNKTKWKYNLNITNPEQIILKCYADGLPKPVITWERDGIEINDSSQSKTNFCNLTFLNQNQELHIHAADVICSGQYLCRVRNHIDMEENFQIIEVEQQNISTINTPIERSSEYPSITIFIIFIFILLCLSIMACYFLSERMHLKRKIIEVETALGLNETRLGPLNPEGMLHEQADFLPYDEKRWEYPEENLEIEEPLGHGFFGIVMKAQAPNLIGDGKPHTVAVKKLKQSDFLCPDGLRVLEIELRILANLEKHSNVVNLLGACTKKAAVGRLMVILEYCALGNLLNYLRQNSSTFIDQIDPSSGTIDSSRKKSFEIHQIGSGHKKSEESRIGDSTVMNNKLGSVPIPSTIGNNLYTPGYAVKMTADDDDKSVSTHHLLMWAFQTACAMEYLSSKKILHGDLAARNILLTKQRVAKISDFGLARTIPEGKYYKKVDSVMPMKWMAIESIEKRKYSTQSDVWSFGIVLWEIFTLGKHPYAGLNPSELIISLYGGQRLEMPIFATEGIYKMMLRCWNQVPEDRPSFRELVQDIGKIY